MTMWGHEDARSAIMAHLQATLPGHLAEVRDRRTVTTPADPVSYLLADTLTGASLYPCVLVRSTDMTSTLDAGDGVWVTRYGLEVVVAVEVPTVGAYVSASVDRDRLLEGVRVALLTPRDTLRQEVTIAAKTMTESAGPAAETLIGRPLAVGVCAFTAVVTETMPRLASAAEYIDNHDLTVTAKSETESI